MGVIGQIIGYPLGWIMWAIYKLVSNYGIAIILFALVTKLILFPISVKQQKSMARMNAMNSKIQALQKKYGNNKEKLQEEQMRLYSEEGVNPMGGCTPMLLNFLVLFGIIDVVYKPLTYILRLPADVIKSATEIAKTVLGIENMSGRPELMIVQAFSQNAGAFSDVGGDFFAEMNGLNMHFLGNLFDLGATPTATWPMILVPILAGVTQLGLTIYMQWYQKKTNPGAPNMAGMQIMMYAMPLMSVWFTFNLPAGAGFYWIIQSVLSFIQQFILNKVYTPEKVQALIKKEDEKKKKSNKKTYMQMAYEQQQLMKNGTYEKPKTVIDENGEERLSKSAQKELNSKIIAEARRRMAEKYGDEYDDRQD